ncbi:MAG: hypothetical protein E7265_11245 [Lachnospiraceae bacterium]|nr:hypothetical protein [Lachnospiraceae bacterium]
MIISVSEFDIRQIADSGQCFRINKLDAARATDAVKYSVIHEGKYLEVCQKNSSLVELSCDEEEYEKIWKPYFDMDTDYKKIQNMIDSEDKFLLSAAEYGSGIRILKQEPWEMIISFIISQRKSIPAIKSSIEKLCKMCGDRIEVSNGEYYAFPDAYKVASLSLEHLNSCGMGYRSGYISSVARQVAQGDIDIYAWNSLSDDELLSELLKLRGVGAKVAGCVMLFGYYRVAAFPKDVWINRALSEYYPKGFPFELYPSCAGIMQQYIFNYMRKKRLSV